MASLSETLLTSPSESRDYIPLLRWLLLMALTVLGLGILGYLGLIQLLLATDRTHISSLIFVIFVLTSLYCLYQTVVISRETVAARRVAVAIEAGAEQGVSPRNRFAAAIAGAKGSQIAGHIANLGRKSAAQNGRRIDQTLLLRALAERLRRRERIGWFVSEALLRLALLGTAIGFILMLVPIAGLTAFDAETLRKALAGMSGGMAVALNVTVTGIAGALVLKLEYFLLNGAISELYELITEVTEVHVVSALEQPDGQR